jgi:hypothetical protein
MSWRWPLEEFGVYEISLVNGGNTSKAGSRPFLMRYSAYVCLSLRRCRHLFVLDLFLFTLTTQIDHITPLVTHFHSTTLHSNLFQHSILLLHRPPSSISPLHTHHQKQRAIATQYYLVLRHRHTRYGQHPATNVCTRVRKL